MAERRRVADDAAYLEQILQNPLGVCAQPPLPSRRDVAQLRQNNRDEVERHWSREYGSGHVVDIPRNGRPPPVPAPPTAPPARPPPRRAPPPRAARPAQTTPLPARRGRPLLGRRPRQVPRPPPRAAPPAAPRGPHAPRDRQLERRRNPPRPPGAPVSDHLQEH